MAKKLTSRKFWLSAAALLGSIGTTVAGLTTSNETIAIIGVVCAVVSSGIYAVAEAVVDKAAVEAEE